MQYTSVLCLSSNVRCQTFPGVWLYHIINPLSLMTFWTRMISKHDYFPFENSIFFHKPNVWPSATVWFNIYANVFSRLSLLPFCIALQVAQHWLSCTELRAGTGPNTGSYPHKGRGFWAISHPQFDKSDQTAVIFIPGLEQRMMGCPIRKCAARRWAECAPTVTLYGFVKRCWTMIFSWQWLRSHF